MIRRAPAPVSLSLAVALSLAGALLAADAPSSTSPPLSSPPSAAGAAGQDGPSGQSSASSGGRNASSPPTPTRASFTEQYGVLTDRNIFLRDRTVRRSTNERSASSRPARPVEESFIVRGIVMEDGAYRAYVEDTGRSATTRVTAGDSIARGKVARIEIDGIEYDAGEKQTWVLNGSDLTGRNAIASSIALETTPTTGPTTLPFDPNDPNLSIEQRMRLRRMQGR